MFLSFCLFLLTSHRWVDISSFLLFVHQVVFSEIVIPFLAECILFPFPLNPSEWRMVKVSPMLNLFAGLEYHVHALQAYHLVFYLNFLNDFAFPFHGFQVPFFVLKFYSKSFYFTYKFIITLCSPLWKE